MPDDARPTSHCLLDLAPPDIKWFQDRSDIILIPIGSCEQHGAHLPLGTDTITALEVSRRAAEKADVPYAPPFWAGYSPQHLRDTESSVGTITLRASTFNEVLFDIARSLIHHGWNKLDLRQRARLEHEGDRPAAAPHQVRDRRVRRALQAVRRALHRDPRRRCSRTPPTRRRAGTRPSWRRRR